MPLFGYFGAIWGRHSVVPHLNRALRLGMAGRRSGDTINFLGQPDARLRHWEWCAYGQVHSKVGTVRQYIDVCGNGPRPQATQTRSLSASDPEESIGLVFEAVFDPDARPRADRQQYWRKIRRRAKFGGGRAGVSGGRDGGGGAGMWVDNYHAIMIVIIIAKLSKSCQHALIMIVGGPRVRI